METKKLANIYDLAYFAFSFCSVLPVRLQTVPEGMLIWLDRKTSVSSWWYGLPLAANIFLYSLCGRCSPVPLPVLPVFSLGNYTHLLWMTEDNFLFAKECREASRNWVRSKPRFFFLSLMVLFSCIFWANPRQVVNLLDSLHQTENMVYKGISVGVLKILSVFDFQNSAAHNPPISTSSSAGKPCYLKAIDYC